jgi:hypothetical protein
MITIINKGPYDGSALPIYELSINDTLISKFQHPRSSGLAACLRKAADSVTVGAVETKPAQEKEPLAVHPNFNTRYHGVSTEDLLLHAQELEHDKILLAMLASPTPMFYNPLDVAKAKEIRDRVLVGLHIQQQEKEKE